LVIRFLPVKRVALPLDWLFNRLLEWWMSLPKLLLIVIVAGLVSRFTATSLAMLIALFEWPLIARVAYGVAQGLRSRMFIHSARVVGLPLRYQLLNHVVPRIVIAVLPLLVFMIAEAVVLESALSFLGVGTALEEPSWGRLLHHGRGYPQDWYVWVPAAVVLMIQLVALQSFGRQLQKKLDTRYEI
jgi:ABC-type dipeptide/oligopeptide/nickel transport system permease subunit